MTILIIALPIIAMILAFVFVFSRRSGQISADKKKINMKMNELEEELKKRTGQNTGDRIQNS
jgi:predicted Holliday junction resolvase-like endonuclease